MQLQKRLTLTALDAMRSVAQNLGKAGFHYKEGGPFIPFILTRKIDIPSRREFDSSLRNPRQPVTADDVDQFLENHYRNDPWRVWDV